MELENVTYHHERKQFYATIPNYWHDLYDMEYSLYQVLPLSEDVINEIRFATEKLGKLFFKTARLLRHVDDDTLLSIGFQKETLSYIRLKTMQLDTVISRMDFVWTNEGLKLLEINSDTPTFIKECFEVNDLVCDHFAKNSPNINMKFHLTHSMMKAIEDSMKYLNNPNPYVVFTSHNDHIEDWETTKYLQSLLPYPSHITPLSKLQIDTEGVYDEDGNKIDILYRQTYPIEHLIFDADPITGEKVGQKLLRLIEEKKVAIINPPSAFLLQSKGVQSVIWGLMESNDTHFFNEEEKEWIKRYMLPTYLEKDPFIQKEKYVQKPCFGREGDTVVIFEKDATTLDLNPLQTYKEEQMIYQKYVDLPKTTLETEKGMLDLHLLIGSFFIGGKASAIGIRAGGQITGNDSYFLPVCIENEEE